MSETLVSKPKLQPELAERFRKENEAHEKTCSICQSNGYKTPSQNVD